MDDAEIVATIAAGELNGLAAALDRYAVSLFEYCHSMAPEAAVDVVHDTFIVAWSKVADLRDPDQLYSWLETVAGNECFRRTLTDGEPAQDQAQDLAQPTEMPPGLPGRVISECADETPAGRALRVWVTNRAGPFDRDGFPAAAPGRRNYLAGRGRIAVAAALAVLAVGGVASAALVSTGAPRHNAAAGKVPGIGTVASGAPATSGASLPTTPASPIASTRAGRVPRARSSPEASAAARGAMGTGRAQASPPAVMVATMPPPPQPQPPQPPPPAQGVLAENPPQLVLVMDGGGGGNGGKNTGARAETFQLTAENGPVNGYTIVVPPNLPGTLIVSPASGSLPSGGSVRITVTAVTTVPFTADFTIYPGDIVVQVTVKVHGKGNDG